MKKFLFFSALFIFGCSYGQTFEITDGQSMCMIGKGKGQDATINPYADEEYSYALVENIGIIGFEIRIESTKNSKKQFTIKPNNKVAVKLYRNNILYFDALTLEKVKVTINYTISKNELPPTVIQ